jgi:hypothetical protein
VGGPIPSGDPDPYDKTKKYCFITNLDLKVNGESPLSFKGPGTRWECPMDFLNLQTTQGFFHTNKTNSIDPELFQRNAFIASWNLSNSTNPNLTFLMPTVPKTDTIEICASFSEPLPEELVMIIWTQVSSAMSIDKNRRVGLSYYNSYNT